MNPHTGMGLTPGQAKVLRQPFGDASGPRHSRAEPVCAVSVLRTSVTIAGDCYVFIPLSEITPPVPRLRSWVFRSFRVSGVEFSSAEVRAIYDCLAHRPATVGAIVRALPQLAATTFHVGCALQRLKLDGLVKCSGSVWSQLTGIVFI